MTKNMTPSTVEVNPSGRLVAGRVVGPSHGLPEILEIGIKALEQCIPLQGGDHRGLFHACHEGVRRARGCWVLAKLVHASTGVPIARRHSCKAWALAVRVDADPFAHRLALGAEGRELGLDQCPATQVLVLASI